MTLDLEADLADAGCLVGSTVRIHRDQHSCVYRIAEARAAGRRCSLTLGGSDVFTGRVRMDNIDSASATISTATSLLWSANLGGMHLLTDDLKHSAVIASAQKGAVRLAPGSATEPLIPGTPAWIADFGPGDQVEIEGSISLPATGQGG